MMATMGCTGWHAPAEVKTVHGNLLCTLNLLTFMFYHFNLGWNKKGLAPQTVITHIKPIGSHENRQNRNEPTSPVVLLLKTKTETASCPRGRTKITVILEFKNTIWHHLHRKVICDLPARECVHTCAFLCVCLHVCEKAEYLNIRVLFLQLVLSVHHGYGCLTELH